MPHTPRLRSACLPSVLSAAAQRIGLAATSLFLLITAPANADDLTLAVATNFVRPLEALVKHFETSHDHDVIIVSGSTGQLYAQVRQGAPFDILLAADQARPARLIEDGMGVDGTQFTYAIGRLVLWSRDADIVPSATSTPFESLAYRRLAIANPALAPYGVAAQETLTSLGHDPAERVVFGQNIGQVYAMAVTGHADLALIAQSQRHAHPASEQGSGWLVPATLHAPIRQDAVLLERASRNTAATEFMAFLRSPQARQIIMQAGYDLP